MTENHPITPPPELVQQWLCRWLELPIPRQRFNEWVSTQAAHVMRIEEKVDEHRGELDNIGTRLTTAETAILNIEEGVSVKTYSNQKKQPSFLDLIHGEKPPFYERFRQGCEFNEETMPGESIAKILRFIAVEVERMTERDMGGSFTVSNLTVGRNLRELADEAEIES